MKSFSYTRIKKNYLHFILLFFKKNICWCFNDRMASLNHFYVA